MMKYTLGLSTGCLYRLNIPLSEKIKAIKNLGCNAIELGLGHKNKLSNIETRLTSADLEKFEYVSAHAPSDHDYKNNSQTKKILSKIAYIHNNIRQLNLVVVHPDIIKDYSVFKIYDLPFAIENSDNEKIFGQEPQELLPILKNNTNFKLVMDVNHIYVNDRSMSLANNFYEQIKSSIAEIHLSGCAEIHDPLFETKQTQIIKAIKNSDIPIIIESPVNSIKHLKKEYLYVKDNLK